MIPQEAMSNDGKLSNTILRVHGQFGFEQDTKVKQPTIQDNSSTLVKLPRITKINKQSKLYQCPLCDYKSKRNYNLSTHIKTHDKNRIKDFNCPLCPKSFDRRYDRERHLLTVHDDKRVKEFSCLFCEKSFKSQCGRNYHMSTIHSEKHIYECLHCKHQFAKKDTLDRHLVQNHSYKKKTDLDRIINSA
jgi:uncharacterized Zn-finger protein